MSYEEDGEEVSKADGYGAASSIYRDDDGLEDLPYARPGRTFHPQAVCTGVYSLHPILQLSQPERLELFSTSSELPHCKVAGTLRDSVIPQHALCQYFGITSQSHGLVAKVGLKLEDVIACGCVALLHVVASWLHTVACVT